MAKYTIIIEKANSNYSAYCPDLPGCVATGATEQEVVETMKEAIKFHLEGLKESNMPVPETKSSVRQVEVNV